MTAAPLPRHSLDHRSPLPARAPEIAVPSMTGSRQTPHVHDEGDDAIDRPGRSVVAEAALRSLSPATIITLASDSPSAAKMPRILARNRTSRLPAGRPRDRPLAPRLRPGSSCRAGPASGDLPGPRARSAL